MLLFNLITKIATMKKTAAVGPRANTTVPGQNEEPANTETVEIPTEQPDSPPAESKPVGGDDDASDKEADVATT